MANAEKNLQHLQAHLEVGEEVESFVEGTYEAKLMGSETVRKGVLVATDRRLLFFGKKMTGYDLESFPYGNISSLEQGKNMLGGTLRFFASGNTVSMKWIDVSKHNLGNFMTLVQSHMNRAKSNTAPPHDAGSEPDVMDQLKKLGELRDAGIVSDDEFEAKKRELLSRL